MKPPTGITDLDFTPAPCGCLTWKHEKCNGEHPAVVNERVARKLGWTLKMHPISVAPYEAKYWHAPGEDRKGYGSVPDFCRDATAAHEIIVHVRTCLFSKRREFIEQLHSRHSMSGFRTEDFSWWVLLHMEPKDICMAFLGVE